MRFRDRNVSRSRVARSIQCTSSMTSTTGVAADERPEQPEDPLEQAGLRQPRGQPGAAGGLDGRGDAVGRELGDDGGEVGAARPEELLQAVGRDGPGEAPERGRDRQVREARDADVEAFADEDEAPLRVPPPCDSPGPASPRARAATSRSRPRRAPRRTAAPLRPTRSTRPRACPRSARDPRGWHSRSRPPCCGWYEAAQRAISPSCVRARRRRPQKGTASSMSAGVPGANPTPDGGVTARSGCRSPHSCRRRPGWKPRWNSCTAGWSSRRS